LRAVCVACRVCLRSADTRACVHACVRSQLRSARLALRGTREYAVPHAEYCSCGGTGTREYFRTARAVSISSSASSSLSSDEKWPIQLPLALSNDVRAVQQLHNGFAMYQLYACYATAIQRLYTGHIVGIPAM
jgi:hypothetical protein